MKLLSIKQILESIPEMGTLELYTLESKISNELDLRFKTRTIIFVRKR